MSDQPLISICLPTYNGVRYVAEAVRSAAAQTYRRCELVVSDSGSTDGTLAAVRSAAGRLELRVADSPTPGMVANWNATVSLARGEYIKFLFQDDLLEPECLQRMLAAAQASPDVSLVYCRRRLIVEEGFSDDPIVAWLRAWDDVQRASARPLRNRPQCGHRLLHARELLRGPANKLGEPTAILVRRDALLRAGPFNDRMRQLVDAEMWMRVMASGSRVAFVSDVLVGFRVHAGQMSVENQRTASDRDDAELARTLAAPKVFELLHPSTRAVVRRRLAGATPPAELPEATLGDRLFAVASAARRLAQTLCTRCVAR